MTDGNTAFHVGPVLSEGEMKSFQDMFARIANTITQASELATKVNDLIHKVDDLDHSLSVAQARNSNLDEALLRVRTERDELSVRLSEVQHRLNESERNNNDFIRAHEVDVSTINGLNESLTNARKDRDDAQFQVLTLTEELEKVKAQLASVHAALGIKPSKAPKSIFGEAPQPEQAEPVLRSEPVFVGEGDGFKAEAEAPKPERRKVYRDTPEWDYEAWLAAPAGEYGSGYTREEDWYYAKD